MSYILQGLSIVLVLIACIGLLRRFLEVSGIKIKKQFVGVVNVDAYIPTKKDSLYVFSASLLFRFFVLIVGFIVYSVFLNDSKDLNLGKIVSIWYKWDARHYIGIANGYTSYNNNGDYLYLVFFPLYSWLLGMVRLIVRQPILAGILTSSVCYSVGCAYLYKLMSIDHTREMAKRSVVLMSVFPFAFFYGGVLTESTFLMTSLMTLYYIRMHKWSLAGIVGFFCALSRSAGVFVVICAFIEFIEEYKLFSNPKHFFIEFFKNYKKWLWLLLIPLGLCVYLGINYTVSGNAFEFLRLEEKYWFQTAQPFFKTIGAMWENSTGNYSYDFTMGSFAPGLFLFFAIILLLIYDLRRQRTMFSVWLLMYLIINTSMSWPISICRYLCVSIPMYMSLGYYSGKNEKLYQVLLVSFSILFGVFLSAYFVTSSIV